MRRFTLGTGLVASPLLIYAAGFVQASGCQYDCWDQGVGAWAFASVVTAPGVVIGAWLLRARSHRAMWAALALASLLYIGLAIASFL